MYGVNRDSKLRYCFRYLYFHGSPYFPVSNAFDAVYELLDKQLFSNSKSDIVMNVFTDVIKQMVNGLASTIELWCTWESGKHSRS